MCVRTHILSNINICTQKVLFNVKKIIEINYKLKKMWGYTLFFNW